MSTTTDVARYEAGGGLAHRHELTVDDLIAQVRKIQTVMGAVMKEGEHYGKIPGTDKPTLFKAGAEKLCLLFRLDPQYESGETYEGRHLTIKSRCVLWHIPTGLRMGSGEGSCSTKESKYAYRVAKRRCPKCGAEAIIKSKFPPRGRPQDAPGWWCNNKAGGCGEDYAADAPGIVTQEVGRTVNEDVADTYNTVLKMANKRALVAGVLNTTAASDIFTQDLEDYPAEPPAPSAPAPAPAPRPAARSARPQQQDIIETTATVVPPPPAPAEPGATGPSYDPFGAVTMLAKLGGGSFKGETMERYFGPGIRNKSALEKLRAQDDSLYRHGYERLHAEYETWKAGQAAA